MRTVCLWLLLLVATAWGREVPVTILDTTDLHGHVEGYKARGDKTEMGGLERCATVIRETRATEKNVLLVDAGDTIQGTAASWLSGGMMMVKALNSLRYDAWVLGNHEFDWGLETLTNCMGMAEMPVLAANVSGLAGVRPFVIRDVDGVKVAIIGLTTPGIPNWSRPRLIPGLKFAESVETLRGVVTEARRAGAQVLVLVAHQGFKEGGDDHANQVSAVARRFPELAVIIGGHSHREFSNTKVSGVLYNQADFHGRCLGRVDLVFDTEKRRVTRSAARTIRMDETVREDETLLALTREERERAAKYLAEVVGEAKEEFGVRGGPKRETAVQALICDAIREALVRRGAKVDAVVHGILGDRETLAKGPVTVSDVWRIVPYENTVGVAQLTGKQLREVLDENAGAYEKHEFRGMCGLRWRFDPRASAGRRVVGLEWPDGRAVKDDERVAVAFNSYELASGGLRWPRLREVVNLPETKLVEYDGGTREAVVEFVRKRGVIAPAVEDWWAAVTSSRRERLPTAK